MACLVAVAVAQLAPVPARFRMATDPEFDLVNGFVLDPAPGDPHRLDLITGALSRFRTPQGDLIDFASCSPWFDDDGEYQVVGRWVRQTRAEGRCEATEFGLARYSMPSGRVLDQIPMEIVPASDPCWFPGMSARILYSGSDGQLYRLIFEGARGHDPAPKVPTRLTWQVPGLRDVATRDPFWSTDPRLGGRVILSLSYHGEESDERLTPARLWWLQLNRDASAVIDAGPLTDPGAKALLERGEERFASTGVSPDGQLMVVYLRQHQEGGLWDLRLGTIGFDPATGRPVVHTEDDRVLATDHLGAHPSFSPDGRHVFGILQGRRERRGARCEPRVIRFPAEPGTPRARVAGAAATHPSPAPPAG